jgi:hypothetical protein
MALGIYQNNESCVITISDWQSESCFERLYLWIRERPNDESRLYNSGEAQKHNHYHFQGKRERDHNHNVYVMHRVCQVDDRISMLVLPWINNSSKNILKN